MNKLVHTWECGTIRLVHSYDRIKGIDKHVYILEKKSSDSLGSEMWYEFSRCTEGEQFGDTWGSGELYLLCRSLHELKSSQLELP